MITVSYSIQGGNLVEVGGASRKLKEQLKRLGVQAEVMRRVMIAAYEAEANVAIHAFRGTLFARLVDSRVDMEIVDQGPGIPDVALAMVAGYSTASEDARKLGFGAGMGLPNIKRASDRFEIETRVGRGTRILSTVYFKPETNAVAARSSAPHVRPDSCVACLGCVRSCPMEAIRLVEDRPRVLEHLCIGCAACVEACRHAVFTVAEGTGEAGEQRVGDLGSGDLGSGDQGVEDGTVLAAPLAVLGGLGDSPEAVLDTLSSTGFREVRLFEEWEEVLVAKALEIARSSGAPRPVIAPVCTAVVNLIESSYPSLIPNLVAALTPAEAAAHELELSPVLVVVGCPAQASALQGAGSTGRVRVSTPSALAACVRAACRAGRPAPRDAAGERANTPGDSPSEGVIRADGVRRAIKVLAEAERGLLDDVAVLDLRACEGGCAGSPLFAGDPAVNRLRLRRAGVGARLGAEGRASVVERSQPFAPRRGVRLDEDMRAAMEKLRLIDELTRSLPGRDCAVCGAPSCAAHAEDIVLGRSGAGCPFGGTGGKR